MTRRQRRFLILGTTVGLVTIGVARLLRDPLPHFVERRSSLAGATVDAPVVEEGHVLETVRVTATSGLAVNMLVRRAIADTGRKGLPLALILGGHYTGREAARMLGETPGVVVAAMSYPYEGDPRPDALTFLRDIPRIRGAFLDTPPAIMLALDYLLTRPEVDHSRVEAVGVSLGAPFVSIAGSLDTRFTRVWVLHGSGGSYTPLERQMRREIPFGPARVVAAAIANLIIDGPRLDPVHWVAKISPRPFMMVNASDDERLPRKSIEALYASAREPKELIWMPGVHIHADKETISKLLGIVMNRMTDTSGQTR
jgi:dienelactone hydrolase